MSGVLLPEPVLRPPEPARDIDLGALAADLRDAVDGEVRFDAGSRAAYSTDASNYREVPLGVVVPRTVDAAVAAVAVCRRHDAPLTSRGGGTSLAGESTNTAVVLDWSRYCHRLLQVDEEARTCLVEPGIVLDALNAELKPTGLEYGPAGPPIALRTHLHRGPESGGDSRGRGHLRRREHAGPCQCLEHSGRA